MTLWLRARTGKWEPFFSTIGAKGQACCLNQVNAQKDNNIVQVHRHMNQTFDALPVTLSWNYNG
jgi:hypothetical protein